MEPELQFFSKHGREIAAFSKYLVPLGTETADFFKDILPYFPIMFSPRFLIRAHMLVQSFTSIQASSDQICVTK